MRHWYEHGLGWPTADGEPLDLVTGVLFDVLEAPAPVGHGVLNRFPRTGPVALHSGRMSFLIATGGAEELPDLLGWLEWNGVPLDLVASGTGGRMRAPAPVAPGGVGVAEASTSVLRSRPIPREAAYDRTMPVWLRPPGPDCSTGSSLPSTDFAGRAGSDGTVGLTALVSALATGCHRARLADDQPWTFSYASRIAAGTRPRSFTS